MSLTTEINYVYWLHLPAHTDPTIEGYIGVSNNPARRLWEHTNDIKNNNHSNPFLSRIMTKYKNIIQTIIYAGNKIDCFDYEKSLRPNKHIGWNINKGGYAPPSAKGRILSEDHKIKIGLGNTSKTKIMPDSAKVQISKARLGKPLSADHIQKIKIARKNQIFTLESKQKMSNSHKGKIAPNAKTILTPLGTFNSIKSAANAYNVSSQTIINWSKYKSEFQIL